MTLSRQSTLLTWLAALAVAAVALLTGLASVEVERQTEEIIMAISRTSTARNRADFRFISDHPSFALVMMSRSGRLSPRFCLRIFFLPFSFL